ncbi:hypothetical protein ABIF64_003831 [Bradyrhizobium japonicum]|uniref:hypothetical protein n=1 Tax=Bradyrhizobium japonicum TaxID=375 RepID=UPI0033994C89
MTENKAPSAATTLGSAQGRFDKAIQAAVSISGSRIGVDHTGRQNRALFIYGKLISHCLSIKLILDKYSREPEGVGLLDHFSVATLGRAATDACLMTMYIAQPSLKQKEWELRRAILYLHELFNRKRFLTASVAEADRGALPFFQTYEAQKVKFKEQIETLAKQLLFSDEVIEELMTGQKVFIGGARGAAREAGWDLDRFDFQQAYLSNWVHSHPVSFIRADEQEISFSQPSKYQFELCAAVLEIVLPYLETTTSRMEKFTGSVNADPIGKLDQ